MSLAYPILVQAQIPCLCPSKYQIQDIQDQDIVRVELWSIYACGDGEEEL
jgi:hypothetical protein